MQCRGLPRGGEHIAAIGMGVGSILGDGASRAESVVRHAAELMTPEERALSGEEGMARYNGRLARIYLDEQAIGGVPMQMDGFCLFAPGRRSSLPLCLAYEAAKRRSSCSAGCGSLSKGAQRLPSR